MRAQSSEQEAIAKLFGILIHNAHCYKSVKYNSM